MLGKKVNILLLTLLTLLSTVTFAAKHTQYSAAVCTANTSYLFDCGPITANGAYSKTLGDSTVTVNLTFGLPKTVAYSATIEPGQTYLFGCQQLTTDGDVASNILQQKACGCDSTVNFTLHVQAPAPTVVKVGYAATITAGQTYLFGCKQLTASGEYKDTLHLAGKDSITILTLTVAPAEVKVGYAATITAGDTYLFGCQQLTASGEYKDTLHLAGKDSITILTLTVAPAEVKVQYDAAIKTGETYLFGCAQLTASGTYSDTLHLAGKDSIVFVNLTVAPAEVKVQYDAAIKTGETYLFGCAQLTASGTYSDTLHLAGKDSIVFVNLTVAPAEVKVQYDTEITVGDIYLFGCKTYQYTETGPQVLKDTLHLAGKDSIVFVNLTVSAGGGGQGDTAVAYTATIKPGQTYLFGCQQLTSPGTYYDTLPRVNLIGDSAIVLTLVNEVKVGYDATIKQGETYLFGCQQLTAAGEYADTLHLAGKDSITILTLKVVTASDTTVAYTATIKQGETYLFGCKQLTAAGEYKDTLSRLGVTGDSITVLTLSVCKPDSSEVTLTACDSITWKGTKYTTSGDYTFDTLTVAGCDSVITLHLTVNHSDSSEVTLTVCDSITWKGTKYTTSGDYTFDTLTVAGCDSVITLHLTVNHSDSSEVTLTVCDSITWKGTKYTTSGDYTFDTLTVLGCDSVITLHLTVNHSDSSEVTLTVCDSITWKGTKYTTSGDYTFDTLTVTGCDSVITLHLTVNHSDSSEVTLTACDSITWKGTKYTTSGDYTFDTLTVAGCDSVITLHLTIYHSESSTEVVDTCNMYTWHGVRYTKTDIYYDTLQTVHGCDSICKLDLTITLPYQDTLTLEHYYGDRVIMINRHEINALGWKLDSLDLDHPEYVKWYRIEASGDTTYLKGHDGYYYTMPNGDPISVGTYFAVITIEPGEGARCGAQGMTETYTVTGAAPAPALVPSLARPGQDIRIINLDPTAKTDVRIYSADGLIQNRYTVSGSDTYTIKAAGTTGFYLVELYNEGMKSTLRYIVK